MLTYIYLFLCSINLSILEMTLSINFITPPPHELQSVTPMFLILFVSFYPPPPRLSAGVFRQATYTTARLGMRLWGGGVRFLILY